MNVYRAAAIAAAVLTTVALPAVGQQTPGTMSQQGQMSDMMVQKVGTALRHVATIRQDYMQRAQGASPQQQHTLDDQAGREMLKAISDQGLTVQQYQQAIQMAQNDTTLKQRLLSVAQSADQR